LVARTLITTADERTWPKDTNEPVLFLGEWCRRYSREHVWSKYDAEVAPYHWDDRTKLYSDYKYITRIYEHFLRLLSRKLNDVHGVNHSLRYWRILIGPWLGYFIQMLFDRWYMLSITLANNNVNKMYWLESDESEFIPNDMSEFTAMFVMDDWNEIVYSQILGALYIKELDVVTVSASRNEKDNTAPKRNSRSLARILFKKMLFIYNVLVSNKETAFFISSYLPLKNDLKLQLKLGQLPTIWRSQSCPVAKSSFEKRENINCNILDSFDEFSKVVAKLIPKHLPTAYLEGYQKLKSYPYKLGWPSVPKFIFTSNAYLADDVFKQWAAEKTEINTPLVIGQHGGHFGMNPFSFDEEHQIKIADRWLSWGWSDDSRPQIIPVGNLKDTSNAVEYDPTGGALMVEMAIPRQSYHLYSIPISRQWLDYFQDQQLFLKLLPLKLRNKILLRLYSHDYGWDQFDRWKDTGIEVKYDLGKSNIISLIKKSRLYISTYNATTYLESLNWNIPTIIFWNPVHWELNEDVAPYFMLLKSVGIFHETPESAAQQMIKVWDDVDVWWKSVEVQAIRMRFCDQYTKKPKEPLSDLNALFHEIVREFDCFDSDC
jgi:putative transferase (TIGR04331 family)